ncbi:MAG: ATP-binding protein [Deltaproteobacteria bacterium]|uniref:ATP-binding protein n=1 Tax=Desulfobacula sp. TaxID=2593537 RepID=UPI00199D1809|nr:ATP-binding protein [Candidatus Desulfobacula maris]MBL6993247.1 ATP-binding protein [Desulfobacula sp.]
MYQSLFQDLISYKQMVFIAGPRQAGKTSLTKMIAEKFRNSYYFNWDIIDEKRKLVENPSFYENMHLKDDSTPLVIFDELHKFPDWKNYLKNVFDRDKENYKFIVSGSGKLDLFQKGGDSLAGRYLLFNLWPFTLAELSGPNLNFEKFIKNPLEINLKKDTSIQIWEDLKLYSGFPDPYLQKDTRFYKIWSNTYKKQLLREDIRDMASLRSSENVEILYSLLPSKIGSLLSMASLSRDIKVSFDSIKNWLALFEKFFMVFRILPWSAKISRAITKERKIYLFDYASIDSKGAKFENMVALELYRAVSNWNDKGLGDFSLNFIRNREKQEVDFVIIKNNKPFLLIETKLSDDSPGKSLIKFQNMLNIDAVLLVDKPGICKKISYKQNRILIISADHWLSYLP